MAHCIRCGENLPSAGAECPSCQIAFDDVVEDSAFIDDDDFDEQGETPTRRSKRWDKYLDESPVFAGAGEDVAPSDERVISTKPVPGTVDEAGAAPVVEPIVVEPTPAEPPVSDEQPAADDDEPVTAEVEPVTAEATPDEEPDEPSVAKPGEAMSEDTVEALPTVTEEYEAPPVTLEPMAEDESATEAVTAPTGVVVVLPMDDTEQDDEEVDDEPAAAQEADPPEAPHEDEPVAAEKLPLVAPVIAPIATTALPRRDMHTGPADVRISTRFELHSAPADASPVVHALVDLEPSGAPLVDGTDGPLAHVVLALDLSASMNDPRKYPVLTRAIENMLEDLRHSGEGDVLISLVVFAYGAEILLRAEPASTLDTRDVLALIDRSPLRFSRYTDIVGALTRAGRIAYDSHRAMPRVPVRIYVMTDGKPQDVDGAHEQMALIRRIPVDVHGFAFGDDADFATLQEMICGGRGGTVKHVRPETLSSAFERVAEVARRVVAKRALLDIELKNGVVGGAAYRFRPGRHAYGKQAFDGGRRFRTDLGTLESGRRYALLVQLRLPQSETDETELGRITLRIPGEGGAVTFERLLFITRHAGSESPDPDAAVLEARHVVEAVNADDPRALLKALKARRRLYADERRDPYILELIDKAIEEMETSGSLDALSNGERAALESHTQSVVGAGA